jgi:DNA invertase Pin-like site-specific DNA recombinase
MTKIAYSYIRYSRPEQAKGHSLTRQTERAEAYAQAHGLALDDKLNMRDQGVSGYSGKNITDGALGAFLKEIEAGRVVPGSFLLIEDIDRLSRLPVMDAYDLFRKIIGAGITIVTLGDGAQYSLERLRGDWTPLMPLFFAMARGHGESERKSDLLGKVWRAKKATARETGAPLGNTAPMWLTYSKEEGYQLHPERTALVKRIFQLSIDGYGMGAIGRLLNDEGTKTVKGKEWGNSSLDKILNNRSVIGEYQPRTVKGTKREPVGDPIKNYYPAAIDEATFYRAQQAMNSRRIFRTTKKAGNFSLWQGIAKCYFCNSPMHLVMKGKAPKGHAYLRCYAAKKHACEGGYVRLDSSELAFREVLVKMSSSVSLVQASSAELARQVTEIDARIEEHASHLQQLAEALQSVTSPTLIGEVVRREGAVTDLKKKREELSLALASDAITDKEAFFAALDLVSYEGRNRANSLLKELKVTVRILPSRRKEPGKHTHYYVYQEDRLQLDFYMNGDFATVVPHTDEQLQRMVQQEANILHGILSYNQNRKR